jgi:hypothetical protein
LQFDQRSRRDAAQRLARRKIADIDQQIDAPGKLRDALAR